MTTISNPFRKFTYSAGVSGAPRARDIHGGEILPHRVAVEWFAEGDGWQLHWAQVSGAKIKADGKPGTRSSYALLVEGGDDWPEWLTRLVADQTPQED